MKKINFKIIIYYIIILIFVVCGFFVGTGVRISDGGYMCPYAKPYQNINGETSFTTAYEELGNYTRTESICWYDINLKVSKKYLIGNKDSLLFINIDILEKCIRLDWESEKEIQREYFYGKIYYDNIVVISIFFIVLFVVLPLTYISLTKRHKNKMVKKNLEKLKELADMKEHGVLSEKEYTERKQIVVEKTQKNI